MGVVDKDLQKANHAQAVMIFYSEMTGLVDEKRAVDGAYLDSLP